jgi:hypothetical protein
VIEAVSEGAHLAIQFFLAGMGEGWVADVVRECQRLGEIFIQAQGSGESAGDLRNFDRVGEAVTKVIGETFAEDLGFVLQAAKGAGVDDAVAIPLELVAIRM